MSKLRVENFMMSADGFSAGPNQGPDAPMGERGTELASWFYPTRTFRTMIGQPGGRTGVDDSFAARGFAGIGANIMGRNMFTPERGPWVDPDWKGWWGPNPPYHTPVFVMTHHPRESLEMEGGNVFHFVTGTPAEVLAMAREAAKGRDIRLNGGTSIVRQFLQARLIDHLHIVVSPLLLGSGEALLSGIDLAALGYRNTETVPGEGALHLVYQRQDG